MAHRPVLQSDGSNRAARRRRIARIQKACDKVSAITYNRYRFAFKEIAELPPDKAVVLTWGERWQMPGTEIEKEHVAESGVGKR
jgi:hypothetical protein